MNWKIVHIDETDSTNSWLRKRLAADERSDANLVIWAEYQTAGRGCGTNRWESERGENLTFSMAIHPKELPATQQFHISMAISLAICEALGQYIGDVSIKWPNDIYWRNGKIGGILIENTLKGSSIMESIIGVGLNVNQRVFKSDAPNPVSMWQICEHETDRETLLKEILEAFERIFGFQNSRTISLEALPPAGVSSVCRQGGCIYGGNRDSGGRRTLGVARRQRQGKTVCI